MLFMARLVGYGIVSSVSVSSASHSVHWFDIAFTSTCMDRSKCMLFLMRGNAYLSPLCVNRPCLLSNLLFDILTR
jgi:hypothetical protein